MAGKRPLSLMRGCGSLRPSIVLYDETYPIELAESIATLSSYDMRQKVDFVLVMGTSLKVRSHFSLAFCARIDQCTDSWLQETC